jgi:hypothetical protein
MVPNVSYFVLLFLIALAINSVFHAAQLVRDWRQNGMAVIQMGLAFALGAAIAVASGRGVLSELHVLGPGNGVDWLATGLALATGVDNLSILQALGSDAPKPTTEPGAVPQVVEVSGQIRVQR